MRKFLLFSLPMLLCYLVQGQNTPVAKGITTSGIKGVQKSLSEVITLSQEHPVPANFRAKLRPELEGPEPRQQNPDAKRVSKFGSLITSQSVTTPLGPDIATQLAYSNFLTIWGSYASVSGRESPYTPPDNCGDVGFTQVIATANCRMKVFTKPSVAGSSSTTPTGTSIQTLTSVLNFDLNTFFANSSLGISGISDPHVRFDRFSGRWFIVAIDVNHTSGNNYCCVAVSDQGTLGANSKFTIFYFNESGTGGSSRDFFDYPTLGIDSRSLYIGGNMFSGGRTFSGVNMWVLDKASLISGSLTVTSFPHNLTGTDMYTPQGVHNDDPASTYGYFIGASQTQYSKLVIRRVSYSGSTPSLSGDLNLTTSTTYTPKSVPTLGGTSIDGNDRRLCAAMIKKNKISGTSNLWVAQGTLLNSSGIGGSGGDRDGALWLEIGNLGGTPSILQAATLYDPTSSASSASYYTYPTIALSGQGHSLMGFTSAGPAKYAQASAAERFRNDAPGTFHSATDFTTTTSTYNPGASRWGDFTQTVVDPLDDMTMWTFTEYVPTNNAWGVRAAQFKAPPPAAPTLSTVPACGSTTNVTITGTSTNNSEFFDPGTGYNRLGVSVAGPSPLSVSNINFVGPTSITADMTVPANAASGSYTLTITNPDGQTSSTNFNLSCSGATCGDPTNLQSTNITTNSATVSWNAVSGSVSYTVDYKLNSTGTWTNAASATTAISFNLTGLTSSSAYDWRVRANCSSASGNFVQSQFTTLNQATCNTPANLTSSSITATSATVSWSAVSGASSYDVDYSLAGASSWTNAATATSSLSANITGLSPLTAYDWRVRTNCSSGSSGYSSGQFTTADLSCDTYEPNNSITTATSIPTGTDINGLISTSNDVDYYTFSTSGNQKNLLVTLTNLPANYNLTLYDNNGKQLQTSTNSGTTAESVAYNSKKPGTYVVLVSGVGGAYSATNCYTLNVTTGSNTFTAIIAGAVNNTPLTKGALRLYPVPASSAITISFDASTAGKGTVTIVNQLGQEVYNQQVDITSGSNLNNIDVSKLTSGVYLLKLKSGDNTQSSKLIINK